jgi:N-acetylglucosaminyldiphosphoundecaprenol N-acetyl-beta-D-mannosaminyltransferase
LAEPERVELFGMPLDLLTMEQTVDRCVELVEAGVPAQHVVVNAGKVVLAHRDSRLREIISACELVNADGQSVVWAGRMAGYPVPERVAGVDLMDCLLREAHQRAWPVYFLGARPKVLERFLDVVRERFPSIRIGGSRDGYFDDDAAVAEAIGASQSRLVLVGMPSPRKEYFVSAMLPKMGSALVVGVGGSFDVWAGLTKRAPEWMQRVGLEWLYRFAQEPRRMWKRYLVGNAGFIGLAVSEVCRVRRCGRRDRG